MVRLRAAGRALVGVVAAALLAGSVASAAPATASTTTDGLELSLDGTTWSTTIPEALFDELPVLVPGDTVTRELMVRNTTGTDALLRIDAVEVRIDNPDFARSLHIGAAVAQETGRAQSRAAMVPLDGDGRCTSVLPGDRIEASGVATVIVMLAFDEHAPPPAQNSSAGLSLLLSASRDIGQDITAQACPLSGIQLPVLALPDDTEAAAAGSGPTRTAAAEPDEPTGAAALALALTGTAGAPMLAAAAAVTILGVAVAVIGRRRERRE
ncbi:hypothetical protein [Arenivirga flava]|uniref:Gram-positive cocci surface proteins LPxTG domain-containing protein n=1 Tax=Arenivirga flava TaxID=1930060 RepID=A0AA37UFZ5_9MICO|nr:hypothetical protein [Arenivirga flava]GMA29619.1 hypothetical protein GCM10025874_28720 [Arenivirga flava]